MTYLEELLPVLRKGVKIRQTNWKSNRYIYLKDDDIFDEFGLIVDLSVHDIKTDKWELCKEPEPDWGYIIKNKCLCWFWDGSGDYKNLGILIKVNENNTLCRYDCRKSNGDFYQYANCRPVRRDEVTFYEDKKDEQKPRFYRMHP